MPVTTNTVLSGQTSVGISATSTEEWVIDRGGTAIDMTVSSGGKALVEGTANFTTVLNGGLLHDGDYESGTIVSSGGTQLIDESGPPELFGSAVDTTIYTGGFQDITSGCTAIDTVFSGGTQRISTGAEVDDANVTDGFQVVLSGGTASSTIIGSAGHQYVSSGATVIDTIFAGGHQDIFSGAEVDDAEVTSSGSIQNVFSGATTIGTSVGSGGCQLVGAAPGLSAEPVRWRRCQLDGGERRRVSGHLRRCKSDRRDGFQRRHPDRFFRRHGLRYGYRIRRVPVRLRRQRHHQHDLQRRPPGHLFRRRG